MGVGKGAGRMHFWSDMGQGYSRMQQGRRRFAGHNSTSSRAPFVAYRMRCIDHACRIAGKPTIAIRCATCLVSLQRDAIATCGRRSMRLDADAARIAFWARRQILSFRARVRRHQAAGIPEHKSFGPSCLSGGSSVMWRTTLQVFGRSSPSKMLQVYALRLVCDDIA